MNAQYGYQDKSNDRIYWFDTLENAIRECQGNPIIKSIVYEVTEGQPADQEKK